MWGLPKLAHYIDDIAVDLEDVTKSVTEGFSAVSAEIKALRNVALQNRAALDYMLASSGGVCHIIGQECCTFIPDASGNLTYLAHTVCPMHTKKSGSILNMHVFYFQPMTSHLKPVRV
uniref:ERVV2 protein n=1 Tax=Sphaeramia orbicularis TaxID=375764 RepID=A0A673BNE7_9TELE